jgi:hypothetical protein
VLSEPPSKEKLQEIARINDWSVKAETMVSLIVGLPDR